MGAFKSSLKMVIRNFDSQNKEFYGQEINTFNNPKVDRILIGVCNNLISRIEILNQNELVATREIGFMDKMSLGETQTLSIDFYDHTNHKYQGTSKFQCAFIAGPVFLEIQEPSILI